MLLHHHIVEPVGVEPRRDVGNMATIGTRSGILFALAPEVANAYPLTRSKARGRRLVLGPGIDLALVALGSLLALAASSAPLLGTRTTTTTDAATASTTTCPAWRIAHASLLIRPPALTWHSHLGLPGYLLLARGV